MFCPLKLYFQSNIDEDVEEDYFISKTLKDLRIDIQDILHKNLRHIKKDMDEKEIEKRLSIGISNQVKTTFEIIEEINDKEEICNIYTEKGTKATVSLPDGSKVWLNSDSKISYPVRFPGDTREVNLSGEAYFEVVSDSLKPMIVTTSKGYMVKVLGTKFHIKSYENDTYSKVTLNSGNIKLICPADNHQKCTEIGMKPNETVILGKVEVPKVVTQTVRTNSNDVAWKRGELVFDRTPMSEAIKMIERWHGATFIVNNNALFNRKLTATFKTESLVQILEVIKMLTGIEYTIEDGNMVVLK